MTSPLRIALRRFSDFEDAMAAQVQAFAAASGEPLPQFSAFDLHGLHHALFARNGFASGEYDLALFSTDWIAEARAANLLADLSPHLAETPDWPSGWPASLTSPCIRNGHTDTIPWHDGPEALLYRADRFADPTEQAAYQARYGHPLAPPRTWDEFHQVARFFTRPDQQQWGTLVAAYPDGHNTLYDLTLQLWSRGGDWTQNPAHISSNLVAIDTPAMADSLAFYRALVTDPTACHPQSPQLASTETGDLFTRGEAVMMVNWFGFAARSERPGSPVRGQMALAPIPSANGDRSVSLSAFWVLGIAQGSQRQQQAAALLRFLMQPEQDLQLLPHGAVPVRLSTWRNAAVQADNPPYAQLESLSLGARTLPQSVALPRLAALADYLTQQAITTNSPVAAILHAATRLFGDLQL